MARNILVVDDDAMMRAFMADVLAGDGHAVDTASSGEAAVSMLGRNSYDLVVTDLRMPGIQGLELIAHGRKIRPEMPWVVVTAYGSIDNAVEAMKAGAADYLAKPFRDPAEVSHVVARVLRQAEADARISLLSEEIERRLPPPGTLFLGEGMGVVRRLVEDVAPTPASVLLSGQSGTGKELVARAIHASSPRAAAPFVAVHCAALAEGLLESELFGHERGAFTGAVAGRKGRFEAADGGTLFLDEIGEISPAVQVKLLRVLQEREFERVGGSRTLRVDVRIVAATHRDLKAEVAAGRFREDLYYRINVFPITLPPLAERVDAIGPLAGYFCANAARSFGKAVPSLAPESVRALERYGWPGNVRELQNVIERAVILSHGTIIPEHLNLEAPPRTGSEGILKDGEREAIRRVLREVGGNRKEAARILGISLRTLQYRIREYGG